MDVCSSVFQFIILFLSVESYLDNSIHKDPTHHFCDIIKVSKDSKKDKCGEYFTYALKGYNLDWTSIPLEKNERYNPKDESWILDKIRKWCDDKDASPECTFTRSVSTVIKECCGGWQGKDCDEPVCNPSCANGGMCLGPGTCNCPEPYVGLSCQHNTLEASYGLKFCYKGSKCDTEGLGEKVTTKEHCCDVIGGYGWGVFGGVCSSCLHKNKSVNLNKPHVIANPGNLAYRTCMNGGSNYYRTFDGLEYFYQGRCTYTLFTDSIISVTVKLISCESCSLCQKELKIVLNAHETVTSMGDKVKVNDKEINIPAYGGYALRGLHMERNGDYTYLDYGFFRVRWNNSSSIFMSIDKSSTDKDYMGLCGNSDGNPYNDMMKPNNQMASSPTEFGNSWKVFGDNQCPDAVDLTSKCSSEDMEEEAYSSCSIIFKLPFSECHDKVDVKYFFERCMSDYCNIIISIFYETNKHMQEVDKRQTVCLILESYSQQCASAGVQLAWRNETFCAFKCSSDMVHTECMPRCMRTCSNLYNVQPSTCSAPFECIPGCQCPTGKFAHLGMCLLPEECPCRYQGQYYDPGRIVTIDCNKCKCSIGRWQCTEDVCSRHCKVIGLQHIETFDGKKYNFHGPPCSYVLVEKGKNAQKNEAFLSKGNLKISYVVSKCLSKSDLSCTESINVHYSRDDQTFNVEVCKRLTVKVNGEKLADPRLKPFRSSLLFVKKISSHFVLISGFGFKVLFELHGAIEIKLEPFYAGMIAGLCGNMDGSVLDDTTSKNDLEEPLVPFAMSYSSCPELYKQAVVDRDPCAMDVSASEHAHKICAKVGSSEIFKHCLKKISWSHYRDICLQDTCANSTSYQSLCTTLAALAHECCLNNEQIDWLKADPTLKAYCGDDYTSGSKMEYTENLPKYQTCRDVQAKDSLRSDECVAGIRCKGKKLLDDYGKCKLLKDCTCYDASTNTVHDAGAVITKSCATCICQEAAWNCSNEKCSAKIECPGNQVYRKDLKSCGKTCATFGQCEGHEPLVEGCGCPDGQVLSEEGQCISPSKCPCKYNSVNYKPNDVVTVGCKIYKCRKQKWELHEEKDCKGNCFASGDPHYQTFDGYHYTYQGGCQYVLSRTKNSVAHYSVLDDKMASKEHDVKKSLTEFVVMAHNVPCGTSGVTCTKLIDVRVGGDLHLQFIQGRAPTVNNQSIGSDAKGHEMKFNGGFITDNGMFTFVSFDAGVELLWDRATRIYIMLASKYSGKVEGMCGDYDGNYLNDFSELSEGNLAKTPNEFARLWKTSPLCPDPDLPQDFDPCVVHPHRIDWAKQSCSIIIDGHIFKQCRLQVINFMDFYKDCLYDACGCDSGGDCECLCTAVAAFAKECNDRGVYVSWRSHHFCPIMCDEDKVYKECSSPCKHTCSEFGRQHSSVVCQDASCVEACVCPEGKVEADDGRCIDMADCPCTFEGNKTVQAGSHLQVNCQNCTCLNGQLNCSGTPCNMEPVCLPNEFLCNDKSRCISIKYVCDHHFDCDDKSDELKCVYSCNPDQFTCASDGECIAFYKVCDGVADCADSSDETSDKCQTFCQAANFFQCANKRCIVRQFVCDLQNDCGVGDDSDEKNCTYCDKRSYRCFTGLCLPMWMRCDGHDDCGDGSDEMNCVCKGEVVSIEKSLHDFEISPPEIKEAILPEPTNQVQLIEGKPIAIRFKGIGKSRFVEVSLWAGNVGQAMLTLFNSNKFPPHHHLKDIDNYLHSKEAAAEYKWIAKSSTEPLQQIIFVVNEVIWSDVAKLTFKPFDVDGDIHVKSLTAKVCYDGGTLTEELTTIYEQHPDLTTLPPFESHPNCSSDDKLYFYNYMNSLEFRITSDTYNDAKKCLLGSHWTFATKDSNLLLFRKKGSDWFIPVVISFKILNANAVKFAFYDQGKNKISSQKKQISVSDSTWYEVVYTNPGDKSRVYMLEIDFFKHRPSRDVEIKDFSMKACLWMKKSMTYKPTKKLITGTPKIEWGIDRKSTFTTDIKPKTTRVTPKYETSTTFSPSVSVYLSQKATTAGEKETTDSMQEVHTTTVAEYFSAEEVTSTYLPEEEYETTQPDVYLTTKRRRLTTPEGYEYLTTSGYQPEQPRYTSTTRRKKMTQSTYPRISSEKAPLEVTEYSEIPEEPDRESTEPYSSTLSRHEITPSYPGHPATPDEHYLTTKRKKTIYADAYSSEELSTSEYPSTPKYYQSHSTSTTKRRGKVTTVYPGIYSPKEFETSSGYPEMPEYPTASEFQPEEPYLTAETEGKKHTTARPGVYPEDASGSPKTSKYPSISEGQYPSISTTKIKKKTTTIQSGLTLSSEEPEISPGYPETPEHPKTHYLEKSTSATKRMKKTTTMHPGVHSFTTSPGISDHPIISKYQSKITPTYPPEASEQVTKSKISYATTTITYSGTYSPESKVKPETTPKYYPGITDNQLSRKSTYYPAIYSPKDDEEMTEYLPETFQTSTSHELLQRPSTTEFKETPPTYKILPHLSTTTTTKSKSISTTSGISPKTLPDDHTFSPPYPTLTTKRKKKTTPTYPDITLPEYETTPTYPDITLPEYETTPTYPDITLPEYETTPEYPEISEYPSSDESHSTYSPEIPEYPSPDESDSTYSPEMPEHPTVPESKEPHPPIPTTRGKKRTTTKSIYPSEGPEVTQGYPSIPESMEPYPSISTTKKKTKTTKTYPGITLPGYETTPGYPEIQEYQSTPDESHPTYSPEVPESKKPYPSISTTKGKKKTTTKSIYPSEEPEVTHGYPSETSEHPPMPYPSTSTTKRKKITTSSAYPIYSKEKPGITPEYPTKTPDHYSQKSHPTSTVEGKRKTTRPITHSSEESEFTPETSEYPTPSESVEPYPSTTRRKKKTTPFVYPSEEPKVPPEYSTEPEYDSESHSTSTTKKKKITTTLPDVYPSDELETSEYPELSESTSVEPYPGASTQTLETPEHPATSKPEVHRTSTKGKRKSTTAHLGTLPTQEIPTKQKTTPEYRSKETTTKGGNNTTPHTSRHTPVKTKLPHLTTSAIKQKIKTSTTPVQFYPSEETESTVYEPAEEILSTLPETEDTDTFPFTEPISPTDHPIFEIETTSISSIYPKVISSDVFEQEYTPPLPSPTITPSEYPSTITISQPSLYGQTCSIDKSILLINNIVDDEDQPVGWIEKDKNITWFATSEDEYVYLYDEVDQNVELHVSPCTSCICHQDGQFVCENLTTEWPDKTDTCLIHKCANGKLTKINLAASCKCTSHQITVTDIPGVCCKCVPLPTPTKTEKCSLKSNLVHLEIKKNYETCKTTDKVNMTYCDGSCPGLDLPHIKNADGSDIEAKVKGLVGVQKAESECLCCSGVKGGEDVYEVDCDESYSVKVKVDRFSHCTCIPCE